MHPLNSFNTFMQLIGQQGDSMCKFLLHIAVDPWLKLE